MYVGRRTSAERIGRAHRRSQLWERVAPGNCTDDQAFGLHRAADQPQRQRQLVDCVQSAHRNHQVVPAGGRLPRVFSYLRAVRGVGKKSAGVADLDIGNQAAEPLAPVGIRAANQKRALETAVHKRGALEAVRERTFEQEQFRPGPRGSIAALRAQVHVEQTGHGRACAARARARQGAMNVVGAMVRTCARSVLDFALPPRCAGCGTIVPDVHSFCAECWTQVEFLGETGCDCCGLPLEATEQTICARCLAIPPRIARTRAAVAYGDLPRSLAIRLKYGRKVAIARTMAHYMSPLVRPQDEAILVPVPLHRTRLWTRGFNQSALVARELSRRLKIAADPLLIRRIRRTPPLKGMSPIQRRKTVAGAFRVSDKAAVQGKTVILVDDVLTTGSTAEACARALKRAGAARIELVSWARVVKPSQLMR